MMRCRIIETVAGDGRGQERGIELSCSGGKESDLLNVKNHKTPPLSEITKKDTVGEQRRDNTTGHP